MNELDEEVIYQNNSDYAQFKKENGLRLNVGALPQKIKKSVKRDAVGEKAIRNSDGITITLQKRDSGQKKRTDKIQKTNKPKWRKVV